MSLAIILEMAESGLGDRIALGRKADGYSYHAVARNAAGGAAVIAAQKPSHVVYVGRNGPVYPQLIFAAVLAGVPFVPMNYRLGDDAIDGLIKEFERPFVITEDIYADKVGTHELQINSDEFLVKAAATDPIEPVYVPDEDPAILLFTSGTTSKPKIVPLRHENLLAYIMSTVEYASADPDEAALVAVPPYHVAAVGSALSNFYSGRRVVYLPDFAPDKWLELVTEEQVSSAMVVPTMLARITEHLDGKLAGADSLNLISYGGARMPRPVLTKALAAFPNAGFCNAYGLTETSSTLALLGPDDHRLALASDDPIIQERLGSIGRPVPGIEAVIRDEEGNVLPAGTVGELFVRGAQISGEYAGQGSSLDADGWFPTKDQAWEDAEGYLYIAGRSDDTIIRGGENIAPVEIEDVLFDHPAVKDVAVIGLADDEWGQRLVAIIVREPEAAVTEQELRDFVRAKLRGSRTPDEIRWSDELPHTPTGKLLRRTLVAQYAGELS